jgi:hypothetical protein
MQAPKDNNKINDNLIIDCNKKNASDLKDMNCV